MPNEKNTKKLPASAKFLYGTGTFGDSVPYTLFFTYFIFFLTDVAGVNPAIAGSISFIAILWQCITGPFFGYISDNSKNPGGRRRPMMIKALIPYVIIMTALFAPVNFGATANAVYYVVMAVFMWTLYSAYVNPWTALGAELTDDYNERNTIRFWVGIWGYPASMLAQSGVMMIVGMAGEGNERNGWFYGVAVCAVIVLIAGLVCHKATAGKEVIPVYDESHPAESLNAKAMLTEYLDLLKLRPLRKLLTFTVIFMIGYTVAGNLVVYNLSYNAGLGEAQQATFWLANTVLCIAALPIVTIVANKIDKKVCTVGFTILFIAVNVAYYFIGITDFTSALIYSVGMAFGTSAYFGIFYSLIYDCVEIYELKTGERKEGGIVSLNILCQTLGAALASLITGWLLTGIGYTGVGEESAETLHGLLACITTIPGAFMAVALIFLLTYKVNQKRFDAVKQAIDDRAAGKEIDMDQFKDLF